MKYVNNTVLTCTFNQTIQITRSLPDHKTLGIMQNIPMARYSIFFLYEANLWIVNIFALTSNTIISKTLRKIGRKQINVYPTQKHIIIFYVNISTIDKIPAPSSYITNVWPLVNTHWERLCRIINSKFKSKNEYRVWTIKLLHKFHTLSLWKRTWWNKFNVIWF